MLAPLILIDDIFTSINQSDTTAKVIDGYICVMGMNFQDFKQRQDHIVELVTHNLVYWEKLIGGADSLYWLESEGRGWAVFLPNMDCGLTRIYRYKPSKQQDLKKYVPWEIGTWKKILSEEALINILSGIENQAIYENWKQHQLNINSVPKEFAEGRLTNTTVDKAMLVTKGNGCAVCGDKATHRATTTLSEFSTVMLSISLCKDHEAEAIKHPCILTFFGTLFFLNISIPDLVKLDHIPVELLTAIVKLIASNLNAEYSELEKRKGGWHVKFVMDDQFYWVLRLNTLMDYAYMLFSPEKKQLHRIDSANHHQTIPFGPDHQHFNSNTKKESITPSFSYGIPLFDLPLLEKSKLYYKKQ
jgi:hypothetical protein